MWGQKWVIAGCEGGEGGGGGGRGGGWASGQVRADWGLGGGGERHPSFVSVTCTQTTASTLVVNPAPRGSGKRSGEMSIQKES